MNTVERIQKRNEIQERTNEDLDKNLNKHGKCCVIRPTGFGKTYCTIEYAAKSGNYDTIVFMSPYRAINDMISEKKEYRNLTKGIHLVTMCYQGIAIDFNKCMDNLIERFVNVANSKRTIFIFDEVHRACSKETLKAVKYLMTVMFAECHFVGLTATPERNNDDVNPLTDLFDGIQVFPYFINNALDDGIFLKPLYVKADNFITNSSIVEITDDKQKVLALPRAHLKRLKKDILKAATLNIENILKEYLKPEMEGVPYFKIIVFFRYIGMINPMNENDKSEGYIEVLQNVFPDYEIDGYRIHSGENGDDMELIYRKNTSTKNKIDVIFCVDKLNMGYHDDELSVIIMNRPTMSDPIYIQELGRPFSASSERRPIIFDFVGNFMVKYSNTKYNFVRGAGIKTDENKRIEKIFGMGNVDVNVSEMENILENERLWGYTNRNKYNEIMIWYQEPVEEKYADEKLDFCSRELQLSKENFLEEFDIWSKEEESYAKTVE